jgi:hypothetical protein
MWEIFYFAHEIIYLFIYLFIIPSVGHSIPSCVLFKVPDLGSQI